MASTTRKAEVVLCCHGRHIEKSTWRHNSALGRPIWMKFGKFMQNTMQIMMMWSMSKPEEEFQYGGRFFLQNGNSYISAVDWVILTIFGTLSHWPCSNVKSNTATVTAINTTDKFPHTRPWLRMHFDLPFKLSTAWHKKTYKGVIAITWSLTFRYIAFYHNFLASDINGGFFPAVAWSNAWCALCNWDTL